MSGRWWQFAVTTVLLVAALFSIPGCSSGGGGAPVAGQQAFVGGTAFKGLFNDGRVDVEAIRTGAVLAQLLLDPQGNFDGSFFFAFAGAKALMACAAHGNFVGEADNQEKGTGNFPLRALFLACAGERATVAITWFTTFVFYRAAVLAARRPWLTMNECKELAEGEVGHAFNLPRGAAAIVPAATAGAALTLWLVGAGFMEWSLSIGIPATELIVLCALAFATGRINNIGPCGPLQAQNGTPLPLDPMGALRLALIAFVTLNPLSPIGGSDPTYLSLIDRMLLFGGGAALLVAAPLILFLARRGFGPLLGRSKGILAHTAGAIGDPRLEAYDETGTMIASNVSGQDVTGQVEAPPNIFSYFFAFDPTAGDGDIRCRVIEGDNGTFDAASAEREPPLGSDPEITAIDSSVWPTVGGGRPVLWGNNFDPCNPLQPGDVTLADIPFQDLKVLTRRIAVGTTPAGTQGEGGLKLNGAPVAGTNVSTDDGEVDRSLTDRFSFGGSLRTRLIYTDTGKRQDGSTRRAAGEATHDINTNELSAINYIQDFDVEVAQTAFIADPIVGVVQDGLVLDVRPTVSNDSRYINLNLVPKRTGGLVGGTIGPNHDAEPTERFGFVVAMDASGGAVPPNGAYFVTTLCWEQGKVTAGSGRALFDALAGTVRIDATLTEEDEKGALTRMDISTTASVQVAADGAMTVTNIDPLSGINRIRGGVTPSGLGGALAFSTPDKVGIILFTKFPTGVTALASTTLTGAFMEQDEADTVTALDTLSIDHPGDFVNALAVIAETTVNGEVSRGGRELEEILFLVRPGGGVFDESGNQCGQLGEDGTLLGTYREWRPDGWFNRPLIGAYSPAPTFFTRRSMPCDYKAIAKGIELKPGVTPDPFIELTTRLGTAIPELGSGISVAGFDFDIAGTFEFETIKSKTGRRDSDNTVPSIPIITSGLDSGFGFGFVGNTLYVFPYPIEGGTKCLLTGCMRPDGEYATLRSTKGFGSAWCAVLVKDRGITPTLDGSYNAQFMCEQINPSPDLFAINGGGPYTYDSASGRMTFAETQVAINEAFTTLPSSTMITGSFTQDGNCVDVLHETFNGDASGPFPFCGLATNDGSTVFLMDASQDGLLCLYVITRADPLPVVPPPPPRRGKFCCLELDFLGFGSMTASVASGRISLGATTVTQDTERITWTNLAASPLGTSFETFTSALTWLADRTYEFTIDLGRSVVGDANPESSGLGSQQVSGTEAPEGNITITDTQESR